MFSKFLAKARMISKALVVIGNFISKVCDAIEQTLMNKDVNFDLRSTSA